MTRGATEEALKYRSATPLSFCSGSNHRVAPHRRAERSMHFHFGLHHHVRTPEQAELDAARFIVGGGAARLPRARTLAAAVVLSLAAGGVAGWLAHGAPTRPALEQAGASIVTPAASHAALPLAAVTTRALLPPIGTAGP